MSTCSKCGKPSSGFKAPTSQQEVIELCRRGAQYCHICTKFGCSDNTNPNRPSSGAMGDGCVKTTCGAQGANCGFIPDGCGGQLDCGHCLEGMVCGAMGPNKCGMPDAPAPMPTMPFRQSQISASLSPPVQTGQNQRQAPPYQPPTGQTPPAQQQQGQSQRQAQAAQEQQVAQQMQTRDPVADPRFTRETYSPESYASSLDDGTSGDSDPTSRVATGAVVGGLIGLTASILFGGKAGSIAASTVGGVLAGSLLGAAVKTETKKV